MRFAVTPRFERRARRLTPAQRVMLRAALRRFAADPQDPLPRTHELPGARKGHWAFAVDDDLRVLFRRDGDLAILVLVGTHDEVY